MDILKKFGNRIRDIRHKAGISQEELAHKSGLHRTYMGAVERGEKNVSLKNIEKIATGLNINLEQLFETIDK